MDALGQHNCCYCYIDTNTFLHYQSFTEIDWCKELNAVKVVLVVCPAVVKELDRKKLDPDSRIREQARRVIAKLSEIGKANKECQIKPQVELLLLAKEPIVDWTQESLSPDIIDDRIIASMLSERNAQGYVVLLTADLGLKLKAQAKGIQWHTLPDEFQLTITKSPLELENARLKERLSRIENRLPKLKLMLQCNGQNESFARFPFKKLPPLSESEINSEMSKIKGQLAYMPPPGSPDPLGMAKLFNSYFGVSQADVHRYNEEIETYLNQMPEYLKKRWEYKETFSRIIKLRFVLINDGTEPAEDIDIFLDCPDGFELCDKDDLPKGPTPPEKPSPPRSIFERFQDVGKLQIPGLIRSFPSPIFGHNLRQDTPRGPFIKKTKSYEVKYSVPKLKHGLEMPLDPVYAIFPSIDDVRSFHISYSIISGNVPDKIEGELHVILDIEDS